MRRPFRGLPARRASPSRNTGAAMRVEYIPIGAGIILVLVGLALIWDAVGPQLVGPMRDRRRRTRAEINLAGEVMAGAGIGLLGVALSGRDWRLETATVLVGTICITVGTLKNWKYFRELLLFRGSARRGLERDVTKSDKMRIR
ncbi:MAG: hypothetical protein ABI035_00050 [Gemmatimonadaceae bacterium]